MELLHGARFADRFKVIGSLGTGHHGPVFLARDGKQNDTIIALKVFNDGTLSSKKERAQLQSGIKAIQTLNSEGIIKPVEYIEQNNVRAITMEYVEGSDLGALLEKQPLTVNQIVMLLTNIGEKLGDLHLNGFVHNEITPAHILINLEGEIRLCGCPQPIGIRAEGGFPLSLRVGKAHYHAPEFLSSGIIDPRNDIYSLGVLGEELLLKNSSFGIKAKNTDVIIKGELSLILEKATSRNPDDRYQNAEEFLDAMEDLNQCLSQRHNGTLFVYFALFYLTFILASLYLFSRSGLLR